MGYYLKTLTVGDMYTNCCLIGNPETKELIIIDPGTDAPLIKQTIHKEGYTPVAILLTHGHFDHIGAANELRRFYNIKIYAGEEEVDVLADPSLNLSESTWGSIELVPDITVKNEEMLELGGMYITVLATPGHTKGGVSYFFPLWHLLFSGDTLFMESVGRTDFPTGNPKVLIESIIDRLFILPDDTAVIPGHGPGTSLAYERKNNPYFCYDLQQKEKAKRNEKDD
ncbi:MAG: MBL fold metallo-hydrolase [Lachnospiraceae bacterium]